MDAQNIGIAMNDYENEDILASAISLFLAIKKTGKRVFLKPAKNCDFLPEKIKQSSRLLISIKKDLSEIYYEKKDEEINLFLTPKNKKISKKDFSFDVINEDEETCCDVVISIGIGNFASLEKLAKKDVDDLFKSRIINIDNNPLNERFGEFNIVEQNASFCKIIKIFLSKINEGVLSPNISTFLLSGINKEESQTINSLIKRGGAIEDVQKVKTVISVLKNFSRDKNLCISFLENTDNDSLSFAIKFLKNDIELENFIILLKKNNIVCVCFLKNETLLRTLKNAFGGQEKNNGLIFSLKTANIEVAKQKILTLI